MTKKTATGTSGGKDGGGEKPVKIERPKPPPTKPPGDPVSISKADPDKQGGKQK